jgi:adenylate cyclase class IV
LASELELKSVVEDPLRLRSALLGAGARCTFRGWLRDRRLDSAGALQQMDEVLRLRRWIPEQGRETAAIAWKGQTTVSADGYKRREEIEVGVDEGAAALRLFEALGYLVTHAIDRAVEVYELDGTVARLEWYPRMDVLVEIEGSPAGMERLIAVAGLERTGCRPDALASFTARYEARSGQPAILAEADLGNAVPTWSSR